jgi:hypothetical protein
MEDSDFQSFQNGGSHNYHGGFFQQLPARVRVPHTGYWNVTVDLGNSPSTFRYGISYLKSRAA